MKPRWTLNWSHAFAALAFSSTLGTLACGANLTNGNCDPACAAGQECRDGQCVPASDCTTNDDCSGDTYCLNGHCTAYDDGGANAECARLVPAGLLSPSIFCEWLGPDTSDPFPDNKQVMSTPLVADFNFDGHKSSEFPTIHPSIVINSYNNGSDGACGLGPSNDKTAWGIIRILDGRTCKIQHSISTKLNGAITPAIGDLNGDGRPDIVAYTWEAGTTPSGVVALSYEPGTGAWKELWRSHDASNNPSNLLTGCQWAGPSIADLNDDGKPEILAEGNVYDNTGKLIDKTLGNLGNGNGQFAVVADIDKDGVPNLVTPAALYAWNKALAKWESKYTYPTGSTSAYIAVGDFGTVTGTTLDRTARDGFAEVVVVGSSKITMLSYDGKVVLGPITIPNASDGTPWGGGPPTVGDFDNDGRAEFAAAGADSYQVFDPDCKAGADPKFCSTGTVNGILWTKFSQDKSSRVTGSALFDFEGNGTAEAIYADECFARIHDGATGEVLFSQQHSSCTWNEYVTIADVQGNFRSKLIVPSNTNCNVSCPAIDPVFKGLRCTGSTDCPNAMPCDSGFCRCTGDNQCNTSSSGGGFVCKPAMAGVPGNGSTCQAAHAANRTGIRVFGDGLDRWVASRPMWNQHAYSITNVTDDGLIPTTTGTLRNWEQPGLNNFRLNVQGKLGPTSSPDATAKGSGSAQAACSGGMVTLSTSICNRGSAPVGDGMPTTFYEGTSVLCTANTTQALPPGKCITVMCTAPISSGGQHDVTIAADDDGTGKSTTSECYDANNKATMSFSC